MSEERITELQAQIATLEAHTSPSYEQLHELCVAYHKLAHEFRDTKTPQSLAQSFTYYDKSIETGKKLPKDEYKYQNYLARTYGCRGEAQDNLPEKHRKASSFRGISGVSLTLKYLVCIIYHYEYK